MELCHLDQVKPKCLILKPGSYNLGGGHEEGTVTLFDIIRMMAVVTL